MDNYETGRLFDDATIDETNPKHLGALRMMCEWGLEVGILVPLLDLAGVKLSADERRFLTGPIVVHRTGWMDLTPEWVFDLARAERFEIVVEKKPMIVGPCELTAVMYGAMLEAPRTHDLTELYLWASVNAAARHYKRDPAGIWQNLDHRPIEDSEVIERGGRLWNTYQPLANSVVRKVIDEAHEREREERRREEQIEAHERAQEEWRQQPPSPPRPVVAQQTLF